MSAYVPRSERAAKLADAKTWAGYRYATFARQTGGLVVVLDSVEAEIDDDPEVRWSTLCDAHASCVGHATLALAKAHASDPCGWCESCREEQTNAA